MKFTEKIKTDKKFLFTVIGIIIATLIIPYITIPALALWWFYKTTRLSKGFKKIAIVILGTIFIIGIIGGFIAYANDPEPHLTILEPATSLTTTQAKNIVIKGTFNPADRKVWINGNKIDASNGSFETQYQLKDGENKIEVSAGDWKRAKILLTIKRELSESEKQANATPTSIPSPTISKAQKALQTQEEAIEKRIRDAISKRTNTNKDKIAEIKINKSFADNSDGKYVAVVTINGSDNLSEDLIKKGIWIDMAEIYMALYKDNTDIQEATIIAKFPMSDKYGNNSDEVVLKTSLSSEEAKKVNWNADKSMLELSILPKVWNTQTNRFR